jgi:hypothetical protein
MEPLTVTDAVRQLDSLNESVVLFVRRPWTLLAECLLLELDADLRTPEHVTASGFDYFLEVPVAREVLEVLGGRETSLDERVRLILHYAEYDAFPDWV